jgi:hypothetical protein
VLLASTNDTGAFLGEDLPTYLLLAFGGAMLVGSLLALFRPPPPGAGTVERPPLARTLVMAGIGAVAFLWALASLLRG